MLQDIEAGREPDIDALLGAVIELGRLTDTSTPHLDADYALVKLPAWTTAADRLCVRAVTREFLDRAVNAVPAGDEPAAVR
jgi:2-dehydropantoate 2-reductase